MQAAEVADIAGCFERHLEALVGVEHLGFELAACLDDGMRNVVVVDEGDDGARLDSQDIRLEGEVVDAHRRLWDSCFGVADKVSGGECKDPRAAVAARHQTCHCVKLLQPASAVSVMASLALPTR